MLTQSSIDTIEKGRILGREVLFLHTTASTNTAAIKLAAKRNNPEGLVVVADEQTGGRGRMGRTWLSPPGLNLYCTIVLTPSVSPSDAPVLTFLSSVSVVRALEKITGIKATVKWPNDIMIAGRKAGGILNEMRLNEGSIRLLTLGIGLNLNMQIEDFPVELRDCSTSARIESGRNVDRTGMLECLLQELDSAYSSFLQNGPGAILQQSREMSSTLGQEVTVGEGENIICGRAQDIAEDGALILRLQNGTLTTIRAGDVTLRKVKKKNAAVN
ncbi:MAG: biotin--[acetyl-CoA-carboxylase] ligase [Nitrospira sp.]|nr:biotin--[acetyl-CoA-carboxylase] ligase [bacterium]MBL7049103.1 biotin--[acetyl-CoA-carboxylase] ligase [Nitrospira sp.]